MVKCFKCESKAKWVCKCSQILLCQNDAGKHAIDHISEKTQPELVDISFPMSTNQIESLKSDIKNRINNIKENKSKIIEETSKFIREIKLHCFLTIGNLDQALGKYSKLLKDFYFDEVTRHDLDDIIFSVATDEINIKTLEMDNNIRDFFYKKYHKVDIVNEKIEERVYEFFNLCVQGHTDKIVCIVVSKDSVYAASGSMDATIRIWDLDKGIQEYFLKGHTDAVSVLAFTPNGKYLISGSYDKTVRVWDLNKRKQHVILKSHTNLVKGIVITTDSKYAISVSLDQTIRIWNLITFYQIKTLSGHLDKINCIAISSNNDFCITGSDDKCIKAWDLKHYNEIYSLNGHTLEVVSLAIKNDNKIAVSGSYDKTVRLWNLEKRCQDMILNLNLGIVTSFAIFNEKNFALLVSSIGKIILLDLSSTISRELEINNNSVNCLAIVDENKKIVIGSDKKVKIWDIDTNCEISSMKGHSDIVVFSEYVSKDDSIITFSNDKTIQITKVKML